MPTGALRSSPGSSSGSSHGTPLRPSLASRGRRWGVLLLAVAQLVAGAVVAATGDGLLGGSTGDSLLVTPTGWAVTAWGVVVAACLAWAVYQLRAERGDDPAQRRAAAPFAGAMAGFVAWLVVVGTAPAWVTALLLVVVLALVALAYDVALRHRRLVTLPGRVLLLGSLGLYTGWAAVAAAVGLAPALAEAGLPTTGGGAAAWQAGVLALAVAAGAAVVRRWRAQAASTLAAAWGLLAVAYGAGARDGGAVLAAAAAVAAVALVGWGVWSRWEDLRRRVEASTVRFGRGPRSESSRSSGRPPRASRSRLLAAVAVRSAVGGR